MFVSTMRWFWYNTCFGQKYILFKGRASQAKDIFFCLVFQFSCSEVWFIHFTQPPTFFLYPHYKFKFIFVITLLAKLPCCSSLLSWQTRMIQFCGWNRGEVRWGLRYRVTWRMAWEDNRQEEHGGASPPPHPPPHPLLPSRSTPSIFLEVGGDWQLLIFFIFRPFLAKSFAL